MNTHIQYAGDWYADKPSGFGMENYPDGSSYGGQYEDDMRHGYGTYTFPSGAKYEVMSRVNMREGLRHMEGWDTRLFSDMYEVLGCCLCLEGSQDSRGEAKAHACISHRVQNMLCVLDAQIRSHGSYYPPPTHTHMCTCVGAQEV
jgi:hypothetical protein